MRIGVRQERKAHQGHRIGYALPSRPLIWNVSLKTPQHLTSSEQTLLFEMIRFGESRKKMQSKTLQSTKTILDCIAPANQT